MNPIIRLEYIELKNFKNIKHGIVENTSYRNKLFYRKQADVIGIYGQNGSGKTSVVQALGVLKKLLSFENLSKEVSHYIHQGEEEACLKFIFYIEETSEGEEQIRYLVNYEVVLRQYPNEFNQDGVYISSEKISYSTIGHRAKNEILRYEYEGIDTVFLPKSRYQEVVRKNSDAVVTLELAKRLSYKESSSFIFRQEVLELFRNENLPAEYAEILETLSFYAKMNLFVIASRDLSECAIRYMPISFRLKLEDMVTSGVAPISLVGTSVIQSDSYDLVRLVVQQLNIVVGSILPEMQIELCDLGNELAADGKMQKRVEILSVKQGLKVPLKYESEGTKKILSILSTLISVYNNPSICLVVDELDSGIFEYLLGELLSIIEKYGQGQLIFTSHNLRALEKLHKESIIVSTANPLNRFVRIPHEKGNRNYRDAYLRSIDLGGVDEPIYQETNSFEISYAFRKAGEVFESE